MAQVERSVSVEQAADHLGVTTRTVRRWIKLGRFGTVPTRPDDGALLISRAALAAVSGRVYTGPDIPPPYGVTGRNRYSAADLYEILTASIEAERERWRAWSRDEAAQAQFPDGPPLAPNKGA